MIGCANRAGVLAIADRLVEIADDLGLRSGEVERLIGVHRGVWPVTDTRRLLWWPTIDQADRIGAFHGVLVALVTVMGREGARAWLRSRNPGLGVSPIRFMLTTEGGIANLHEMLTVEQGAC